MPGTMHPTTFTYMIIFKEGNKNKEGQYTYSYEGQEHTTETGVIKISSSMEFSLNALKAKLNMKEVEGIYQMKNQQQVLMK